MASPVDGLYRTGSICDGDHQGSASAGHARHGRVRCPCNLTGRTRRARHQVRDSQVQISHTDRQVQAWQAPTHQPLTQQAMLSPKPVPGVRPSLACRCCRITALCADSSLLRYSSRCCLPSHGLSAPRFFGPVSLSLMACLAQLSLSVWCSPGTELLGYQEFSQQDYECGDCDTLSPAGVGWAIALGCISWPLCFIPCCMGAPSQTQIFPLCTADTPSHCRHASVLPSQVLTGRR